MCQNKKTESIILQFPKRFKKSADKMSKSNQLNSLKQLWKQREREPGIFRYQLDVLEHKTLKGTHGFYAELNPDRSKLRRVPQTFPSLSAKFDPDKFNFNKIKQREKLMDILFGDCLVTFIVNQSPLTSYHCLICPELEKSLPQKITENGLEFCTDFLLKADDLSFRIGYNSPGALASVNHLHFHLMYIDHNLYIENATLQALGKGSMYRLHSDMPTEAICFIIDQNNVKSIVQTIYQLIEFLCTQNIPHNVFITPVRKHSSKKLKLFLYAREKPYEIKDLNAFNLAFCELSGYIPVGDTALYEGLTEDAVIDKIKYESGTVYSLIYKYLSELNE